MRSPMLLLFVCGIVPAFAAEDAVEGQTPPLDLSGSSWIWGPVPVEAADALRLPPGNSYFRKTFEIGDPDDYAAAWLHATGDHSFSVRLNEGERAAHNFWKDGLVVDVLGDLRPGENLIEGRATPGGDGNRPAGFAARLELVPADGSAPEAIVTGPDWQARRGEGEWTGATVLGPMGMGPWRLIGESRVVAPEEFTAFRVPGREEDMERFRRLFYEFYLSVGPVSTLWDQWLPQSYLWPELRSGPKRARTAGRIAKDRILSPEGHVTTYMFRGMGHPLGWPFPIWTQVDGWGWHFSISGNRFGGERFKVLPKKNLEGWEAEGFEDVSFSDPKGLEASIEPGATLTTPPFAVPAIRCAFVRLEWRGEGLEDARPWLEWTTEEHPEFDASRRLWFDPPPADGSEEISMIPIWEVTEEDEVLTGFRIGFGNAEPARIWIKAVMTAVDTRHNVNQSAFITGILDYAAWTGDLAFLRDQAERLRLALDYAIKEFDLEESGVVRTPWRGHDGGSGISWEDGEKTILHGRGVGTNYWDLLPFGGYDTLATIYVYDSLLRMADFEEAVRENPQWGIPVGGHDPAELRRLAARLKQVGGEMFWNPETGRFAANRDLEGNLHDYGYTFVNLEAIAYGFATEEQAESILDWIEGRRTVEGDTSQGEDIYHWEFGPRSSTVRNIEWYMSVWGRPETIPWGGQVQDGGAVFGFSYFDLLARLKTRGPDNVAQRLEEILDWYRRVEEAGGVRPYYEADETRGSLQGGGTAGGLGIDAEFRETILVPQILLYGFLGVEARLEGLKVAPQLPSDWPSLEITAINYQGGLFDLFASPAEIRLRAHRDPEGPGEGLIVPEEETWFVDGEAVRGVIPFPSAGETLVVRRSGQ